MKPFPLLACLAVTLTTPSFSALAQKSGKPAKKAAAEFDVMKAARDIDKLVDTTLAKQSLKPNAEIDDATFVRRAYLEIAGRVPTIEDSHPLRPRAFGGMGAEAMKEGNSRS